MKFIFLLSGFLALFPYQYTYSQDWEWAEHVNLPSTDIGNDISVDKTTGEISFCGIYRDSIGVVFLPETDNTTVTNLADGETSFYFTICHVPYKDADDVIFLFEESENQRGFSPNVDGINDTFDIEGHDKFTHAQLSVFNRWGQIVFESDSFANEWKGDKLDGNPLPTGACFFNLIQQNQKFKKGSVELRLKKVM